MVWEEGYRYHLGKLTFRLGFRVFDIHSSKEIALALAFPILPEGNRQGEMNHAMTAIAGRGSDFGSRES